MNNFPISWGEYTRGKRQRLRPSSYEIGLGVRLRFFFPHEPKPHATAQEIAVEICRVERRGDTLLVTLGPKSQKPSELLALRIDPRGRIEFIPYSNGRRYEMGYLMAKER